MKKSLLIAFLVTALPLQAWAHEGHGTPGQGHTVAHYVFDPLHLPLVLLVSAAVVWLAVHLRNRWSRADQKVDCV